jgi:hypothetical protein
MKYAGKTTHKPHFLPMLLCSCALMLFYSSTSARALLTLPDSARLIPSETILLVDIHDFSQLKRQFEKTSFYKLGKDPAMQPFIDNFKTGWQEKIRKQDNEVFRIIADADALPQGRVALALILNEQTKDANEPPLLLITQWGQTISKIKQAVEKTVEKAIENGAHRKSEDYRGVDIITIIREPSKFLSYCFIDDSLIGAVNPDLLKFVIAHMKGASSQTLANDADYTATMKAVESSAGEQIDVYINIKQIVKTVIAEDDTGKAKTRIGNLGLDNVTSFGCSIGPGSPPDTSGGASYGKACLKIRGEKKGVCKMLEMESAAFKAPQFIPSSAYSVLFVNLNIKKAFDELGNILSRFSPQLAAIMYMPLLPPSPQGEPPLQLKSDIVDHIGSQIIIARNVSEDTSDVGTPKPGSSLIAMAIDNRGALEKSLSILHSKILAPNNPDARRQLLGHTIYVLDLKSFLPPFMPGEKRPMQIIGDPKSPKMPKLAFTVTDTHLVFASESAVEQAVRALNSTESISLGSAKWFNRAKSTIPSVMGLASLQNYADSGEVFWAELRELKKQAGKSKDTDSGTVVGVGIKPGSLFPKLIFSQEGFDLFDFSLLPEFDAVRKYFGLSAFYGLSRPDGFFFEFKYLNPPDN